MKVASARAALVALIAASCCSFNAEAGGELVEFPAGFAEGVHYATVNRGNIKQELFTSRSTIDAAKAGQPFPTGTVITLVDSRDGKLFRYVVMEKRAGWGVDYPPETRNGEWEFQAFDFDRSANRAENLNRCFGCHKGQAQADFIFTRDRMKGANRCAAPRNHPAGHAPGTTLWRST